MATPITTVSGIGAHTAKILAENGFESVEALAAAHNEDLTKISGFGLARAEKVIASARAVLTAALVNQELDMTASLEPEAEEEPATEEKPEKPKKAKKKKKGKKGKKKSSKPVAEDLILIKKSKSAPKTEKMEEGTAVKKKKKKKKKKASGKKKSQ